MRPEPSPPASFSTSEDADHVVVALDGVLQSGSGHRELDGILGALAVQQGVDQAAAEAVAAADAVDERSSYFLEKQYSPLLASYSMALQPLSEALWLLAQGDGHLLPEVELVGQLLGNALVALVVQGAAVDIGGLGSMPKTSLASSSLEMQTSTYWHRSVMAARACSRVHSLPR